jgi:flavin reductase (DIM6/NTAB) family NADH-FMN oxidoreductase RutF
LLGWRQGGRAKKERSSNGMTHQIVSNEGDVLDSVGLRRALGRFATGVVVVATCTPEAELVGLTANSFAAVSLDPPLVLWSLNRKASSFSGFSRSAYFTVSILGAEQEALARHFAARRDDKFASVAFTRGHGGCPLIADSLATFECRAESSMDGGDHVVFLGRVLHATYREGVPLIFSAGQFLNRADFPVV